MKVSKKYLSWCKIVVVGLGTWLFHILNASKVGISCCDFIY